VCKYEGAGRIGTKRRMRYDIGDAPLEPPSVEPKKTLDPHEDDKLTGDMRELYDRLLPTEDSERRRRLFVEKLEHILHSEWPGHEFKVHVFGSSGNMLCTSDSDGKWSRSRNLDLLLTLSSRHMHSDTHERVGEHASVSCCSR
jgi:DNA polymerase sigma